MSWATNAKEKLALGEQVQIRPRGNSMKPKVNSGDLVTLQPVSDPVDLEKGDIVLVKVKGRDYLHLITAIDATKNRFQIGNNRGHINGWVGPNAIFGIAIKIGEENDLSI